MSSERNICVKYLKWKERRVRPYCRGCTTCPGLLMILLYSPKHECIKIFILILREGSPQLACFQSPLDDYRIGKVGVGCRRVGQAKEESGHQLG